MRRAGVAAVAAAAVAAASSSAAARRAASTLVVADAAGSKLPNLPALVAAARALGRGGAVDVLLVGRSDAALAATAAQASQARGGAT
jgi:hypothetical protein